MACKLECPEGKGCCFIDCECECKCDDLDCYEYTNQCPEWAEEGDPDSE